MNFEFLRSKNSVVILYNAVPGGGTDAVQKLASVPSFCGAKTSTRLFTADFLGGGGTDAVQKLASCANF